MRRPTASSAPDPLVSFDAVSYGRLLSGRARRSNVIVRVWTTVRRWPNPEIFAAGHALPESQINELPFENFL